MASIFPLRPALLLVRVLLHCATLCRSLQARQNRRKRRQQLKRFQRYCKQSCHSAFAPQRCSRRPLCVTQLLWHPSPAQPAKVEPRSLLHNPCQQATHSLRTPHPVWTRARARMCWTRYLRTTILYATPSCGSSSSTSECYRPPTNAADVGPRGNLSLHLHLPSVAAG